MIIGSLGLPSESFVVPLESFVVPLESCVAPLESCVASLESFVVSLESFAVSLESFMVSWRSFVALSESPLFADSFSLLSEFSVVLVFFLTGGRVDSKASTCSLVSEVLLRFTSSTPANRATI